MIFIDIANIIYSQRDLGERSLESGLKEKDD